MRERERERGVHDRCAKVTRRSGEKNLMIRMIKRIWWEKKRRERVDSREKENYKNDLEKE